MAYIGCISRFVNQVVYQFRSQEQHDHDYNLEHALLDSLVEIFYSYLVAGKEYSCYVLEQSYIVVTPSSISIKRLSLNDDIYIFPLTYFTYIRKEFYPYKTISVYGEMLERIEVIQRFSIDYALYYDVRRKDNEILILRAKTNYNVKDPFDSEKFKMEFTSSGSLNDGVIEELFTVAQYNKSPKVEIDYFDIHRSIVLTD